MMVLHYGVVLALFLWGLCDGVHALCTQTDPTGKHAAADACVVPVVGEQLWFQCECSGKSDVLNLRANISLETQHSAAPAFVVAIIDPTESAMSVVAKDKQATYVEEDAAKARVIDVSAPAGMTDGPLTFGMHYEAGGVLGQASLIGAYIPCVGTAPNISFAVPSSTLVRWTPGAVPSPQVSQLAAVSYDVTAVADKTPIKTTTQNTYATLDIPPLCDTKYTFAVQAHLNGQTCSGEFPTSSAYVRVPPQGPAWLEVNENSVNLTYAVFTWAKPDPGTCTITQTTLTVTDPLTGDTVYQATTKGTQHIAHFDPPLQAHHIYSAMLEVQTDAGTGTSPSRAFQPLETTPCRLTQGQIPPINMASCTHHATQGLCDFSCQCEGQVFQQPASNVSCFPTVRNAAFFWWTAYSVNDTIQYKVDVAANVTLKAQGTTQDVGQYYALPHNMGPIEVSMIYPTQTQTSLAGISLVYIPCAVDTPITAVVVHPILGIGTVNVQWTSPFASTTYASSLSWIVERNTSSGFKPIGDRVPGDKASTSIMLTRSCYPHIVRVRSHIDFKSTFTADCEQALPTVLVAVNQAPEPPQDLRNDSIITHKGGLFVWGVPTDDGGCDQGYYSLTLQCGNVSWNAVIIPFLNTTSANCTFEPAPAPESSCMLSLHAVTVGGASKAATFSFTSPSADAPQHNYVIPIASSFGALGAIIIIAGAVWWSYRKKKSRGYSVL
eukprot:m.68705 g.68705  ORF g.68705 m.68705 type:complete len:720 (-) comp12203_c0_seq1:461-2620(-)